MSNGGLAPDQGVGKACFGLARSFFALLALVIGTIHTGKIVPDKTRPITVSSTNALNKAEYNFTMKLETNTIPGCTIQISFPDQQYIDGLGLDYSFVAYSPYGTVIPSSVTGKVLSLQPGYRNNYTDIVLTVQGIQNPAKVGGTGMFKAYYSCGSNIIDICENFGSIAVTQPVNTLFQSYLMVEPGSSNIAGDISNYLIYIAPTNDVSANANFRVTFPADYNFTYLKNLVSDFPSSNPCQVAADNTTGFMPSGNFSCKFSSVYGNVIEWQGNNASIPKKSPIWLRLQNVYNPAREMVTDFLTVEIILKNTNYTYEYDDSVTGLLISPGPIINFQVNPVLQLPLEQSKTYDFLVTFTPTNSFQSLRIVTRFSMIGSCVVKSGLYPLTSNSLITCNINSNVIEISGIQKYSRKYQITADKITVKLLNAKTPAQSGKLIPFELYTYQNGDFTTKVDQDVTSTNTVIFITTSRSIDVSSELNSDRNYYQLRTSFVDGNGITQYTFTPYTIDKTFTCFSDPNSPSVLVIPLISGGSNVGLLLPGAQPNRFYEENILTISNLKNPSVFNTYAVSLVVYTSSSTSALETYTKSVVISSPPFSLTSNFFSYFNNEWTLVEFSFQAPIALEKGNRVLSNFYDQFTVFRFRFSLATAAPNPMFDRFLGYTSATASSNAIPCWASGDLNTYNPGLNCTVVYGPSSPTSTDAAVVTVNNYKALNSGDQVIVQFMVKYATYVSSPTVNPIVSGSIVSIQTNEEFPIGTISQSLTPATNAAGAAFSTLTVAASVLEVQASTTLTFTMNLPASAVSTPTALMIKLPTNWAFSTNIFSPTTVFLDGIQLFTGKFYYNSYAKILYITPRDVVTVGTHTVQIVGITAPAGASATNNFDVSYYVNRAQTLLGTASLGAITCFPMPTITVSSQIPYYGAKGASYFFKWTSAKLYSLPTIQIILPSVAEYNFVALGPYDCDLYINNVLQRRDISPYGQVCTFSAGTSTFQMQLTKDVPAGTTIMVALKYINHPASNPGTATVQVLSSTTDANTLITTSAITSCTSTVAIDNTNVFTSGAFVPGVIDFAKIWSTAPIAEQDILMYFDFTLKSFLPKGSNIEVFFPPTSFVSVANRVNPRCYLIGKQKHLSVCTTYEDLAIKKIIMTLSDDFQANTPLTLEFFGRSFYTKPTYDDVLDNTIGPFSISANFGGSTIATSNVITTWRIYGKIGRLLVVTQIR